MRRVSIPIAMLATVGLVVAAYAVNSRFSADRPGCPGKIVCPQTGQLVCRDQCPTVDPNRADCPGRIVCPQTGELVCVDKCPLGAKAAAKKGCCDACREKNKELTQG